MATPSSATVGSRLFLLLVFLAAGGVRAAYLVIYVDKGNAADCWRVQEASPTTPAGDAELYILVDNMKADGVLSGYRTRAPLSGDQEEMTAHLAPGYPMFRSVIEKYVPGSLEAAAKVRWLQAVLGTLTAAFCFAFAYRAFPNPLVAMLTGLFAVLNPFWIINTAELSDGVLATFLFAGVLSSGLRFAQRGGAFTGFLFGIAAASLAETRAALLPFSIVALLWFLLRSRSVRQGWLAATVAALAFLALLAAPWGVHTFKQFHRVIPIVDSAWWHLWVGNNPQATGGAFDPAWLEKGTLPAGRQAELAKIPVTDQPKRYESLSGDVLAEVKRSPGDTIQRRFFAAFYFLCSQKTIHDGKIVEVAGSGAPAWLEGTLFGTLLGVFIFAFLGWRWSARADSDSALLVIAMIAVPLPYLLSHAEMLHGPRLPLDGVLLCFAACGLACLMPGRRGEVDEA